MPVGGRSLPITLSFEGKMPETNIIITGNALSERIDKNGTEVSRYVSFNSSTQNLIYSSSYSSSLISFILIGKDID